MRGEGGGGWNQQGLLSICMPDLENHEDSILPSLFSKKYS